MADLYKDWFAAVNLKNPTLVQVLSQESWAPDSAWLSKIQDGFQAPRPTFPTPDFSGKVRNLSLPLRNASVFIADGQVLNPGMRPPSEFFYRWLTPDPKSPFNWKNLTPTADSINEVYQRLLKGAAASGGFPMSLDAQGNPVIDPKRAGEFAVSAAGWLNQELHLNIDPKVFQVLGEVSKVDWSGVIKQLQTLTDAPLESLNAVASGITAMSGASATNAMSGAMTIATNAAEIYADGHVSREEGISFGVNTGASIGAYAGSYFYPPIGTAIGAGVGALIGWIAGISADYGPPAARAESFQKSDLAKRFKSISDQFSKLKSELDRQLWINQCQAAQGEFYEMLQKLITETAQIWTEAEAQTGWRFNLRWFDPNPGFDPALMSKVLGKSTSICNARTEQRYPYTPSSSEWTSTYTKKPTRKVIFPGNCETYVTCPHDYGCPYPDVDPVKYGHDGFKVRTAFEDTSRTAAAFAARGFKWLEPAHRPKCADLYDKTKDTGALLQMLAWQVTMLPIAANIIAMDIRRTAIAVQTERDLWANAATYVVKGVDFGVTGKAALISKQKLEESRFLKNAILPTVGAAAVAYWFLGRK